MIALILSSALIYHHLSIGDEKGACETAARLIDECPLDPEILQAHVLALESSGNHVAACRSYDLLCERFPDRAHDRPLVEGMAWSVLEGASRSSTLSTRIFSLIGAHYGQDARGVAILKRGLEDSHPEVRRIAAELAANFRDQPIVATLKRLSLDDPDFRVRISSLSSLGKQEEVPFLLSRLEGWQKTEEEREVTIAALLDKIDAHKIDGLLKSPVKEFKILAALAVGEQGLKEKGAALIPLLSDPSGEVRRAAALALSRLGSENEALLHAKNDIDPLVQVAALYAALKEGSQVSFDLLTHPRSDVRIHAAKAFVKSQATEEMLRAYEFSKDPFVRLNLAIGLIEEGRRDESLIETLSMLPAGKLMWGDTLYGRAIFPTKKVHEPLVPNLPEVEDKRVRLELLGIFAMLRPTLAEEKIAAYLDKTDWGMTLIASSLLLTEGEGGWSQGVQSLLTHKSGKVRIQAALILALWGQDDEAVDTLIKEYPTAPRDLKERILEGLGNIGSPRAIPFLAQELKSGYETLKIIAATALLMCLYA